MAQTIEARTARNVLYYVERYLPASEAFVAQQARSLSRYRPSFLAGSRQDSPSDSLIDAPVFDISAHASARAAELALKFARIPVPAAFPPLQSADVVHAHFGKNGYVMLPLARSANRPLVTTFHGFDATYAGDPRKPGGFNQVRFFRDGRSWMATRPIWTIAVSDFIAARLKALGFPESRMLRHYIGIDLGLYRGLAPQRVPGRVVSVARFVEYKGHKYIIDALRKVVEAGIDVEFVMVGQGPLRDEVERYAQQYLPNFRILNSLSQREIAELMASASLYVHGSVTLQNGHAEAFGLANLEAQAAGTPVVAFDSGGVGEALVPGETGIVVLERDTEAMAAAIAEMLQNGDRRAAYSIAAAKMVRDRFDITRQGAQLEDFYDDVLRQFPNHGWR